MATHSSILARKILCLEEPRQAIVHGYGPWSGKELGTTEPLSKNIHDALFIFFKE